jgi:hypothetical protein
MVVLVVIGVSVGERARSAVTLIIAPGDAGDETARPTVSHHRRPRRYCNLRVPGTLTD